MRGTVAKKIRKLAYEDRSIRTAKYGRHKDTGQIVRMDKDRILYQKTKKAYNRVGE